jgi:hypothetical protein
LKAAAFSANAAGRRIPGRPGADVPLPNQDLPKIWGKGECNGWPFYIIPIQSR